MNNRKSVLMFIIFIIIPLLVGGLSSLLTGRQMNAFNNMNKPALSPPGILFPIVWTILYILMGIGGYMIYISDSSWRSLALFLFCGQLIFNFFWSIIFFRFEYYWFALIWLLIMWIMIITMLIITGRFSLLGMLLFVPLALWTTFAAYLNLMIARLN